ncbi:MAG: hypothetical protein KGM96_01010 [Acidobacteriota bacterium]|nr:hypothetical protein [Acidobacteriota bacterium]
MRRLFAFLLISLMCAGAAAVCAQAVPSAFRSQRSFTVGGMGSIFQPDYAGGGVAQAGPNRLVGIGAYADLKLTRWVQVEGEARLLRFNEFHNIYQDNYLIGPRVPIHTYLGRITPYGKVLFGFTNMNFEYNVTTCRCSTIAYGGGADVALTNRLSLRAIDFEYQQFPNWYVQQTSQLHPYGFSVGFGYKVF